MEFCYNRGMGDLSGTVTILGVVIATIGTLFVVLAVIEYTGLRKLRTELETFRQRAMDEIFLIQKASHKILASYAVDDPEQKVALIKDALTVSPKVYNGHNALGYAYLGQGKKLEAIDAFKDAIHHHPSDKAGYFDLAHAYLEQGNTEYCLHYLKEAIAKDPSAREDLQGNALFASILESAEYRKLQG